ncbi:NADH-quinone oxidoreductase subunit L [Thermosporothrix hazakensis]|jgi:NADH-quinone oxidoreductase subunit L|uniref:NADH-quinone oxidoreductase subunit L n=2 Tax=Thermosporothrix TaxID=768650 RepID=A0A326U1A7_THEHA|nr:NADH-quinone oxidoreductase subunit L [Thermosporothrix hazakensis]PZW23411.1 NADH-quinone oxidoreductase subunit L [Thermosporothrix hazakensis]BBH89756.1 NADH-quinone oxidoreductase subunit L [Thermosporothrix sp. COM3]GCE47945.1 NADH-quinone oxidoreductase subunit L [Thermosporothrix hazakensis]
MQNFGLWMLLPPLLGFIILGLLGKVFSRAVIQTVAWAACGISFLAAGLNFLVMLGTAPDQRVSDVVHYTWMASGLASEFKVDFGILYDPLTAVMMLVITGVGLLIHIYSAGYMKDDPGFWRFFAYLNFFIFSMALLVLANNFLFLLVGWGLVGLASFLLIGFWYQRPAPVAAARKAFVINIIGDFGLMIALFLIFSNFGSLQYQEVFSHTAKLAAGSTTAIVICLLLFVACAAKSAQLPLYMWLPDAMEGPTPVSALIHAATMVTAGVYLVARTHVLFELAPTALLVVGIIGGLTALFAATIALVQLDIKRVLAYSTISQLGYMFMAESVHNYGAGIFHLMTHAFFKALLFLGAGAVIIALAHEQDMRKMGGLWKRMPITAWTFLIATLAISGVPPFAGFWSKDEILSTLFAQAMSTGNAVYYVLWGLALLTAALTAFYMFRLFFIVFTGTYRGEQAVVRRHEEEEEEEEEPGHHATPVPYYEIREVPGVMSTPLVLLGILSVVGGLIGMPFWSPFGQFLEPIFHGVEAPHLSGGMEWVSVILSLVAAAIGFGAAWSIYRKGYAYREKRNPFYQLLFNKYYVDELLDAILVKPILALGRGLTTALENFTLEGVSRGIAGVFRGTSSGLRTLQTGYMRNYAFIILVGVVLIILYYVVMRG